MPPVPLAGKSIIKSDFWRIYNGYIIGIKRGTLLITEIKNHVIIRENDLLWVLGMTDMEDKLKNGA